MPYVYLALLPGHGGFAGSVHHSDYRTNSFQAGLCALGDACIEAIMGNATACQTILGGWPSEFCSVDGQTGAIAHELMHGLGWGEHTETSGLDLSTDEYSRFPDCHLPQIIKDWMLSNPWNIFFKEKKEKNQKYAEKEILVQVTKTKKELNKLSKMLKTNYPD